LFSFLFSFEICIFYLYFAYQYDATAIDPFPQLLLAPAFSIPLALQRYLFPTKYRV
jgi:hypothetical protein